MDEVDFPVAFPPAYCITGHGRSGTSLVAAMLQSGGLSIGSRLMGPAEGNVRGHFEDMDFYDYHVAVLTSQGFGSEGYILQPALQVQKQFIPAARAMVAARRAAGKPWGWKNPRTTLFLDFWHELIPELRFILLFRPPWEVADSMFRRGDDHFQKNPNLAVQVWQNYNRALIDFFDRFSSRCLLVESHAAAVGPSHLTQAIASKFGDHFGPLGELYDNNLFQCDSTPHQRSVLAHFFPEALDLYDQLRSRAMLVDRRRESAARSDAADRSWALQHWVDFRAAEKNCKRTQATLDQERTKVAQLEHDLQQANARLEQLTAEMNHVGRQELERLGAEVGRWQTRAAQASADRQQLSGALERARAQVSWMESSRFWKLRRLWLRAKERLTPEKRQERLKERGLTP